MRIKRFTAFFLAMVLLLSLGAAALATDESQSFEFALTADRSGVLKAGDELTVTCTLKRTDKPESWQMYAWQTEITYDNSVFELVEGSVKPATGVGSSVHPGTLLDKLYFNAYSLSASGDTYPSERTAGTFTLRVTGTVSGTYTVSNTNYLVSTKGGADVYKALSSDLTVTLQGSQVQPTGGGASGGGAAVVTQAPSTGFSDVPSGAWYAGAVKYVTEKGLFNGTGEGTFSPAADMTRAMMVTVLWRLEDKPPAAAENRFSDVRSGAWYTDAVRWAAAQGIVTGYDTETFGTDDSITREQMAVMFYRYAKYAGIETTASKSLSGFTDGSSTSSWALEAMRWAVTVGLFKGDDTGTLRPQDNASRAEVATLFQRMVELTVK